MFRGKGKEKFKKYPVNILYWFHEVLKHKDKLLFYALTPYFQKYTDSLLRYASSYMRKYSTHSLKVFPAL